jgi:hypothetical protein
MAILHASALRALLRRRPLTRPRPAPLNPILRNLGLRNLSSWSARSAILMLRRRFGVAD